VAEVGEQWNVPVENLLQPDLLRRLCWSPPADGDVRGTLRAGGAREWQIDLLADRLEKALAAR
jgi:ribonuclease D